MKSGTSDTRLLLRISLGFLLSSGGTFTLYSYWSESSGGRHCECGAYLRSFFAAPRIVYSYFWSLGCLFLSRLNVDESRL